MDSEPSFSALGHDKKRIWKNSNVALYRYPGGKGASNYLHPYVAGQPKYEVPFPAKSSAAPLRGDNAISLCDVHVIGYGKSCCGLGLELSLL
jgi:hypothetical protein